MLVACVFCFLPLFGVEGVYPITFTLCLATFLVGLYMKYVEGINPGSLYWLWGINSLIWLTFII